jgi:DNA-binding IclR family transcriptional regulator
MLSSFALTGASKADLRKACGLPDGSFFNAVQTLLSGGFIRNEGSGSRQFFRLGDSQ